MTYLFQEKNMLRLFAEEELEVLNVLAVDGSKEEILCRVEWGMQLAGEEFAQSLYEGLYEKINNMDELELKKIQFFLPYKLSVIDPVKEENVLVMEEV